MASKTTRKKFRPPLKTPRASEGGSLPCSQAGGSTTCTGVVETSQGKEPSGKENSQSWLSQLSTADYVGTANQPASEANTGPTTCPSTAGGLQLDDSLCSDISHEKYSGGVPEGYGGDESVRQSPAASLPGTQTHTVLSYCSETNAEGCESQKKSEVVAQQERFQVFDFPESQDTDSTAEYTANNWSTDGSVSSLAPRTAFLLAGSSSSRTDGLDTPYHMEEETDEETTDKEPSRFQRKNKPVARRYNYDNILPKLGPQRVANKRTKKHVSLIVNQSVASNISCFGAAEESVTSKGDLSVYDYQPTPQQEESGLDGNMEGEDLSESNNSRISKRTKEEQVSMNLDSCSPPPPWVWGNLVPMHCQAPCFFATCTC